MKDLKKKPGILKSNILIVLLLLAPILLELITKNSVITYSVKISAILYAIVIKQQISQATESLTFNFGLLLLIASILIASNFLNSVSFQPNIFFNLFWFWYFRNQLWLRNNFLNSLFFSLKICGVGSLFVTLTSLLSQETKLTSAGYFVPLNDLLGLTYRQQGIFTHPNTYGLFSFLLISLTLVMSKKLSLIWISIGLFGLLTSGSRTFQILSSLILVFALIGRISKASSVLKKFRLDGIRIVYLSVIAYFMIQISFRDTKFNPDSLTGRLGIWSKSLSALSDQLFIGLGTDYSSQLVQNGVLPTNANSVHSLYLDGFLSGGILAGMLLLVLFYSIFQAMKLAGGELLVMFFLILIAGFTETMFSMASFGVMNLLFAFAFASPSREKRV